MNEVDWTSLYETDGWHAVERHEAYDIDRVWTHVLSFLLDTAGGSEAEASAWVRATKAPHPWAVAYTLYVPEPTAEQQRFRTQWQAAYGSERDCPVHKALHAQAGQTRAFLLRELAGGSDPWQSPTGLACKAFGWTDRLTAVVALGQGLEVVFHLTRNDDRPFTPTDRDGLLEALRRIRRLVLWLALSSGALPKAALFTAREREVLVYLLRGPSEKIIAYDMELSAGYLHQIIVRIFRKLGVASRAELMAMWLDEVPADAN